MAHQQDLGKWGEDLAVAHLLASGYSIVTRNWRYGKEEVDIIARQGDTLLIVEVKTRESDAFGNPEMFRKKVGGDILADKKTFLMIHAFETAAADQLAALKELLKNNAADKVEKVMQIFKDCKVDDWARELKNKYLQTALKHLEDTAVLSARKKPLQELADYLMLRES